VSDIDGSVSSLAYSLNSDPAIALSIGPDDRRLARDGDFNVDLDRADLNDGQNEVILTATDNDGNSSVLTMTVTYDGSSTWPLPYSIDWSTVSGLQDVVQVVDGNWGFTPSGARLSAQEGVDYDRVLAIGDMDWTDYEITVPITVHWVDPEGFTYPSISPGFGITLRWQGHTDSPIVCPQPHCGWMPSGAGAWYDIGRDGPLKLDGLSEQSVTINEGDTYYWKMRVETITGIGPKYSLKVWQSGQDEPAGWLLSKQRDLSDLSNGSAIVIAHHVDITVGDVTIVPLAQNSSDLLLNAFGNGSVIADPDKASYDAGEQVVLTAVPDTDWQFSSWSGDASGSSNPFLVTMNASKSITATFTETPLGSLLVSDDFNSCTLNSSLWSYVDPVGDATMTMSGEEVILSLPAGTTHDTWGSNATNFASTVPRIRQIIDDTDFEVIVKFDGVLNANDQMEGILVEQDENDMLRLEFLYSGDRMRAFAASFTEGTANTKYFQTITDSTPLYMKVVRVGDMWTQSYSSDGLVWTALNSFTHAMTANAVSLYAGNGTAANEVIIDYAFNSASPIVPEDAIVHTVAVTTVGNGMVNKSPDQAGYACGDEVTLTAVADADWEFSDWSGAISGSTNPEVITISDGTQSVTATFVNTLTYALNMNVVGNGSVTIDPDKETYDAGEVVMLTAVADADWEFSEWSGDATGNANPLTVTMDADKNITATFTELPPVTYTLMVSSVGNGDVTKDPDQATYNEGEVVTLTPVADPGWEFEGWSGDASGDIIPLLVTMDADKNITATFTELPPVTYTLVVNSLGNGDVTINPDQTTYAAGEVVTLTPVAAPGWEFNNWSGDASGSKNPLTVVMNSDKSITASFSETPPTRYTIFLSVISS
jgi:hypothetical protein